MKKFYVAFCAGVLFLSACSQGKDDEPSVEPAKIPINIAMGVWTRATDSAFEPGDKVGIYVVNYVGGAAGTLAAAGNQVDNMRFTYSGAWSPESPIYWKDHTTQADFYCYYPYAAGISDVSAYPFSVPTDQSSESGYKAGDFLWGKTAGIAPTPDPVQITVHHVMSNLLVYLKAGSGYNADSLRNAKVTLCGLKTAATIDLATGKATATGTAADISPLPHADGFRALVVPQSISDTPLIKISIGENDYLFTESITFEANKQHSCTLTVNRTGEGVNIGIGDWIVDENDYGGTVE